MRMNPQITTLRAASVLLMLGAVSCVPAASAFLAVPGLRGPEVTVAIAPMPEGVLAPRLMTTPLIPVAFDMTNLPALDAVTNPIAIPTAPLPSFATTLLNPGPSASAFAFRGLTAADSLRSQLCLTAAIYYEAASESDEGQRAVAQVVLNRVRHPAYPNTVCDVVYQGTERGDRLCQFSFACDGSLARTPSRSAWDRASRVARLALAGYVLPTVGTATHYHTLAVNPYWNKSLTATAIVGAHIFYRWGNAVGSPALSTRAIPGANLRRGRARIRAFLRLRLAMRPLLRVAPPRCRKLLRTIALLRFKLRSHCVRPRGRWRRITVMSQDHFLNPTSGQNIAIPGNGLGSKA